MQSFFFERFLNVDIHLTTIFFLLIFVFEPFASGRVTFCTLGKFLRTRFTQTVIRDEYGFLLTIVTFTGLLHWFVFSILYFPIDLFRTFRTTIQRYIWNSQNLSRFLRILVVLERELILMFRFARSNPSFSS